MERQIQLFQVADLIFSCPETEKLSLSPEETKRIEERFQDIVKTFSTANNVDFASGIKNNYMLPFNSVVGIGKINERLILHFTYRFNEPLFYIINSRDNILLI